MTKDITGRNKVFLLVVLTMILGTGMAMAQVTLAIENSNAHPGGNVNIPVMLSDGTGVAGVNTTVTFSPDVVNNATFVGGELLKGHVVDSNSPAAGEFRFLTSKTENDFSSVAYGSAAITMPSIEIRAGYDSIGRISIGLIS